MAKSKQKFPYTLHCPNCKVGIKIKSPNLIGTRINCPKCKKRVDVVPEEEDAYVSYGVSAPVEEPQEPEPTEEELEEIEEQKRLAKRKVTVARTKHVLSIVWLVVLLGGVAGIFYYFVYVKGYANRPVEDKKKGKHSQSPVGVPFAPIELSTANHWPSVIRVNDRLMASLPQARADKMPSTAAADLSALATDVCGRATRC